MIEDPEQFRPLALFLANRIAWNPADVDDLVEEGMAELHRVAPFTDAKKPGAFASTVLSRKMKDHYPQSVRNRPPDFSLSDLPDLPDSSSLEEALLEKIELATFLEELGLSRGPLSRWVAEQLIFPDHATGKTLLLELEVIDALFSNYPKASPSFQLKSSRVANHRQLRDILGVSVPEWFDLLKGVRIFTAEWMESRGYDLPPTLSEGFFL